MLPKKQRIDTPLFAQILKMGRTSASTHFSFRYLVVKELAHPRIAAVVSKKILKTAVARHRLTRKIYESVRSIFSEISTVPIAVIVFGKAGADELGIQDTVLEIKSALKEIRARLKL